MDVRAIYHGSDGEATKALYARLAPLGPVGEIAVNLFRAQKASQRAKEYRGGIRGQGSFKSMAYGKKNWSLDNLCTVLVTHASTLGLGFGWQQDPFRPEYTWVLYVDLPTGQVSFHSARRGAGGDYVGVWDGIRGVSADRIVRWCEQLLGETAPAMPSLEKPLTKRWLWCRHCAVHWANRSTCPIPGHGRLEPKELQDELRPGVRAQWNDDSSSVSGQR